MRKARGIPVLAYMLLGGLLLSACAGQVRAQRGEEQGANVQVEVNGTPLALTLPARATDDSPGFEHTPEAVGTGHPGDDNSAENKTEVTGAVASIDAGQVTIDGQIYLLTNSTEFKDQIAAGDLVEIHFVVNADGTLTISEIEHATPETVGDGGAGSGGGADDGPAHDAGDDHGGNSGSGG